MNKLWIISLLSGLSVFGLIITNPNKDNYSEFMSKHMKKTVCDQTEISQSLNALCGIITRPLSQSLIYQSTDRSNFILLSIYTTEFPFVEFKITGIGIGGFFFILD